MTLHAVVRLVAAACRRFGAVGLGLVLATAAPAQFVVDPNGGGTHTDLQTAIQAARA